MATSDAILFGSVFTVRTVDKDGKKFEKVSRLECDSETVGGATVVFDIHSELYPMKEGETFTMALARTIKLDGKEGTGVYDQSGEPSLLDNYEYAMHGKVFQYDHKSGSQVAIYISFGGLLMCVRGEQTNFVGISVDQNLYCLIKKTADA